jgi:hypothetical protein
LREQLLGYDDDFSGVCFAFLVVTALLLTVTAVVNILPNDGRSCYLTTRNTAIALEEVGLILAGADVSGTMRSLEVHTIHQHRVQQDWSYWLIQPRSLSRQIYRQLSSKSLEYRSPLPSTVLLGTSPHERAYT